MTNFTNLTLVPNGIPSEIADMQAISLKGLRIAMSACALMVGGAVWAQDAAIPNRVTDQDHWITNNQLFNVLSLDYAIEPQQGWLIITDGQNRFYIQSNQAFPELRMMQAWSNTVNVTNEEINTLNSKLMGGRLFLTEDNKIQLVWEHSYHGLKMNTVGLTQSIERFREIRDSVVELIAEL